MRIDLTAETRAADADAARRSARNAEIAAEAAAVSTTGTAAHAAAADDAEAAVAAADGLVVRQRIAVESQVTLVENGTARS
jgi:hypothetical protein